MLSPDSWPSYYSFPVLRFQSHSYDDAAFLHPALSRPVVWCTQEEADKIRIYDLRSVCAGRVASYSCGGLKYVFM